MLFSPEKKGHWHILHFYCESWQRSAVKPQLWVSCDYVKDSFEFVFPVLIPVGQRLKR